MGHENFTSLPILWFSGILYVFECLAGNLNGILEMSDCTTILLGVFDDKKLD